MNFIKFAQTHAFIQAIIYHFLWRLFLKIMNNFRITLIYTLCKNELYYPRRAVKNKVDEINKKWYNHIEYTEYTAHQ